MIQAFYSAAVGSQQQMQKMNVQANNIANVNTCGFKAEKPAFQALMYGMVNGIGGDQLPKGSGTRMVSTATDFSQAPVEETGRKQDYAIAGDGFLPSSTHPKTRYRSPGTAPLRLQAFRSRMRRENGTKSTI